MSALCIYETCLIISPTIPTDALARARPVLAGYYDQPVICSRVLLRNQIQCTSASFTLNNSTLLPAGTSHDAQTSRGGTAASVPSRDHEGHTHGRNICHGVRRLGCLLSSCPGLISMSADMFPCQHQIVPFVSISAAMSEEHSPAARSVLMQFQDEPPLDSMR